jgi:hypothetical protein
MLSRVKTTGREWIIAKMAIIPSNFLCKWGTLAMDPVWQNHQAVRTSVRIL